MVVQLDNLGVDAKRRSVLASTIIVLFTSHLTTFLRIWSKFSTVGRLQKEDWFMVAALILSYGGASMQLYGLTLGLGRHEADVSKIDLENFNLSVWIIQRFQPPSIFCIKTSMILFYVRLFNTKIFKRVAWGIWIYTLCWTIAAWTSSTFECTPISFFWNKAQPGHCVKNPLTTLGLTNGVLSFAGDLFILVMPLPVIWKLQMNQRQKIGLIMIFLVGLFVVFTSIIRFVALLDVNTKDLTFTQVDAGMWTYMEIGIGITCGNLPLLRPLLTRFFDTMTNKTTKSNIHLSSSKDMTRNGRVPAYRSDGFERFDLEHGSDDGGSEIELRDKRGDRGIVVKRDVQIQTEETYENGVDTVEMKPLPRKNQMWTNIQGGGT